MIRCDNCGFYIPDEPPSNFKGEFGLTCPQCEMIWKSKEEYLKEDKKFLEGFGKFYTIKKIKKVEFVELSFDSGMMDKVIDEFLEKSK